MKKNMVTTDRYIRLSIAAIILVLYFLGYLPGTLGLVLGIVGLVFALTSFLNFCPLYALFGIRTCPVEKP